ILLCHYSEDMRFVMTTVLIQRRWRTGRIEGPITNLRVIGQCSILNIYKRISNLPVFDDPFFRRQVRALGGTSRVGRSVDLFRLGRSPGVGNFSGYRAFIALWLKGFGCWTSGILFGLRAAA